MQLQELFDYKNRLMQDLLTNKDIVLLMGDDMSMDKAESLAYTQIFPCEYVPETVQGGATYICFDVDVQKSFNKTFLQPILYVWVFAHRSRLRLPEGGVRTDKICTKICETINGSRYYGLGELDLETVRRFAPMTDYQGKVMIFYAKDFNRQFNGIKTTPSNRKSD